MQQVIEGFRLSQQQARLWLLQQQSNAYSGWSFVLIEGLLDVARLQHALETVLVRHEIYRTRFHRIPDLVLPLQVIHADPLYIWRSIDLQRCEPQERQRQIEALAQAEKMLVFDNRQSPSVSSTLFTLAEDTSLWSIHLSALCADPQTLQNLVSEVARWYGYSEGQTDDVIQYLQFSEWQNTLLQEERDDERAFWLKQNLTAFSSVSLPCKIKTSVPHSFAPDVVTQSLRFADATQLEVFLDQYQCTLPAFLLTCWFILLWKLIGHDEILVGLSADGRIDDLQEIAGPLAKCLPLLCSLKSQQTLRELLVWVQDASDELLSLHPYFSWDELEASGGSASFVYPFSFEWRERPNPLVAGTVTFTLQHWESYSEPFHVKLVAVQEAADVTLQFQFDRSRLRIQDIQQIAERFSVLVERLVRQPDQPLEMLDILSVAERQQLLVEFNQTEVTHPHDLCLHQLIEQQVARTPDAIALESEQGQLTYEHLNRRANQLAHYLQERGVGPDVLVGIGLERSLELVIGILGILKAGGAYLPLDHAYPEGRLSFMVTDAQADILLTKHSLLDMLPKMSHVVLLDEDWSSIAQKSGENAVNRVTSNNLAYVIYTSGSTGVPKGVMVAHQGLGNLGQSQIQTFRVQPDSRVLQFASLSFDASVSEMVMALLAGVTLCVFPASSLFPGPDLLSVFHQYQITHVTLPPSALKVLPVESLPALQSLVVAGEASSVDLLTRWMGQRAIFNAYGPTETTVCATIARVDELSPLTIGRPLNNTQIYLLDAYLCPVPLGTPGELYIGGVGVGRGYLNRPDLTAERFIAHPFSKEAGARLYKTGDRARYLSADGIVEYLGRLDTQVKLRGYRIEIAEIEAVLRQHPQILDCVVLLQEEGPAAPRLVGYVVARRTSEAERIQETFGEMLRSSLPEYMVPSIFVLLDTLPLMPNGKVDRRQLPEPEQVHNRKTVMQAEPRSPLEEILLTIWKDLLDLASLDIHDNFFAVGGHSLLATQLIAHVRAVLQVELPVQAIFDTPTIAKFAYHVEQALRQGEASQMPPLVARERPEVLPLSFAQQRLWFLEQLDPGNTAYLLPQALSVSGEIDVHVLEQVLEGLIRRHESLRTTFTQQDGQPIQVIHPAGPLTFPLIDLQGLKYEQAEEHKYKLISQEERHPCNLATGPLIRSTLLRLQDQEHVLLLTLHHIIADGWSSSILVREFTTLYQAMMSGRPSSLAPLPIQYADYALWQREWLQGDVLEAQLAYWRTQLAEEAPLELPIDHPRPTAQMYRGTVQSMWLSTEVSEHLVELSQQQNVTLFMLLLASLQILLSRYTGQYDISVGTPIANRRHADLEGVVGFFLNTLVLRTDLSGDPTFEQILHRVREVCLEAYAHQDIPFEKVVEALSPERNLSRSPLFQVLLILQNTPQAQFELGEGRITFLTEEAMVSHFDLTFYLTETEQGLECVLEYDTDLFEAETIGRLLGHWQTVLEGVVQMPQAHLSEVPLLTVEERERLLGEWNATQKAYPQNLCMHQLFEQQVQRTPDALAVVCEGAYLTYQELNRRANQLAHYLQKIEIGPETLVGVCMERSPEVMIALLALFKIGGVYVPLDPSYPTERLALIAEDAQFLLFLTQQRSVSMLRWTQVPLLCVDTERDQWANERDINLENRVRAKQLAYIIYTSGSTGRPKGAMIEQQGMLNHLFSKIEDLTLTSADRVAQTASLSFDISVWQLLSGLLVGGCTVIYDREVVSDPLQLIERIQIDQISIVELVPTFLQTLLESVAWWSQEKRSLPHLCWLVPTGEALSPTLCRRWFAAYPAIPLLNAYGPTECSDDVASYALLQAPDQQVLQVPIGRPVGNMRLYVLDSHQQVLPIGITGELFVGGVGVGRGYLNDPQRTAAVFIPDPFAGEPGQRLYKTGDRVCIQRDGTLEFLGRMDQQVKIRGFRIELGEIEAVLQGHPAIRAGVVLVQEETAGERRLVAYVLLLPGERLGRKDVHTYLQGCLPSYMLPSEFVFLDAFPLMPNGKIDRRALPFLGRAKGEGPSIHQGARTPLEEVLLGLWCEMLDQHQIGIYDNFFEVGGHSLLAMQLIVRIRTMLGVEMPLRAVFEEPTVAGFAQQLEQVLCKQKGMQIPPLRARERPDVLPLSFAQQRLWFLDQLEPGSTVYLLPDALYCRGSLSIDVLERSLKELVRRHESLRTTFVGQAGQPIQVIHPASNYCLPVIDLQGVRADKQSHLALQLAEQEADNPCDLAVGPLLRVNVLRLQKQDHRVFITLHHIITDGWSNSVFVGELTTLYQAFLTDNTSPLEPLPLQYADYALWQQEWLQGEVLDALLDYWTMQLAGASPLELPTDRPRTAGVSSRGAIHPFTLPSSLHQSLIALSRQEGVTLFMTMLTAFQIILRHYTGKRDIVVGTDVANRTFTETEKMIGFFVNLLALRTQLSDQATFRETLKRVRTMLLDAYAHQDLPFEKLVDALQLERQNYQVPLINVLFVMQNVPQYLVELPELTLSSMDTQSTTAKFDVALFLMEEGQELTGYVNYRTDLFDSASITRLICLFEGVLENVVTKPDTTIEQLGISTQGEKDQNGMREEKRYEKQLSKLKTTKRRMIPVLPES